MAAETQEWLLRLATTHGAHDALVDECDGSLAAAAHRLAAAKREVCGFGRALPNAQELWIAAREIASRSMRMTFVPSRESIAQEARSIGLAVL